jgi:hypothetical protein
MKTTAALSFTVMAVLLTASTVASAHGADDYRGAGDFADAIQPDTYAAGYGDRDLDDDGIADAYDDGLEPEAYQQFEAPLQGVGSWYTDATYGRIWVPSPMVVGNDFTPYYTGGHWVLSEYGWTWVSDWSWGWAPFHYGRWITVGGVGWAWVPGTVWGPAWVAWRSGDGYVGWAPLPPRGARIAGYSVRGGASPWRFTLAVNLGAARPSCVPHTQAPAILARTTVLANNRVVTHGAWRTRINAGPVQVARATPVRLSIVSPHAGPRYAIAPRAPRPVPHVEVRPAPQPVPHVEVRPAPRMQPRPIPHVEPRFAPRAQPRPSPVPPHQPGRGPSPSHHDHRR